MPLTPAQNKLIADFIGLTTHPIYVGKTLIGYTIDKPNKYTDSIELLKFPETMSTLDVVKTVKFMANTLNMPIGNNIYLNILKNIGSVNEEKTLKTCIKFIEWFNKFKQKSTNG